MAYSKTGQGQLVTGMRNTLVSDEEFERQCEKLLTEMTEEVVISPGSTVRVKEDGGETRTFLGGDPIVRSVDIRCGSIWSDLQSRKLLLEATKSQIMVNTDHPDARFIVADRALCLPIGILPPGHHICKKNCAREPSPPRRQFNQGGWIEVGDFDPGGDGSETFQRLLDKGLIIDRKLSSKIKRLVKKAVAGRGATK